MFETPVKVQGPSPKLQNMQSMKTDILSSNGGDDLSLTDEDDERLFKNSNITFSSFLDELCGPSFSSSEKENNNNLLSYKHSTNISTPPYNSFYAPRAPI